MYYLSIVKYGCYWLLSYSNKLIKLLSNLNAINVNI